MKRLEKKDWFISGFSILENEGFSKITIDNLCNILNVTKGSFYHHFGNMDGYIEGLMKYWVGEYTTSFIQKTEKHKTPIQKYKVITGMVMQAPYKVEQAVRAWSYSNSIVKEYVQKVDKTRLNYITSLKKKAGKDDEEARHSAILEYAILIGIQQLYPDMSKEELAKVYAKYSFDI
ncbi:MAG: TetR/AcrR family transcriptional regulator [Bacteroidales bacterium]|nr:TetR/AcrR family transcriptional regulator [Bacteroidales bacterium]